MSKFDIDPEQDIKNAQACGNAYVSERGKGYMAQFLQESDLLEKLTDEIGLDDKSEEAVEYWNKIFQAYGKYLALSYTMGYMDGMKGEKVTKLHIPMDDDPGPNGAG